MLSAPSYVWRMLLSGEGKSTVGRRIWWEGEGPPDSAPVPGARPSCTSVAASDGRSNRRGQHSCSLGGAVRWGWGHCCSRAALRSLLSPLVLDTTWPGSEDEVRIVSTPVPFPWRANEEQTLLSASSDVVPARFSRCILNPCQPKLSGCTPGFCPPSYK